MIYVIASIHVAAGRRGDVLKEFRMLRPEVLAEAGCIEYDTAIDLDRVVDGQPPSQPNLVTVVEKWENPAALRAHLSALHMVEFRERVKGIVTGVEIRVLEPA